MILDGTGLFYFKEKHCENCLCTTRKTDDGKTIKMYYHKVLEAKIVLNENVIIILGTEFIENEKEDVSKQDCELNAAKRLLGRLKKLDEGFEWIKSGDDAIWQTGLCKEKGSAFYANHVEEVAEKKEIMNVIEYEYKTKDKKGKSHTIRFQWVTSWN